VSIADELTKLEELRRSGALSDEGFAQAKARLLNAPAAAPEQPLGRHLSDQLSEVQYQNELARLDREWEMERQQYMVRDRYGARYVPTAGLGIGAAVVGGLFGIFWTVMAVAITSDAPDIGVFSAVKVIFPLFGVLFTAAAVGYGLYAATQAQRYQRAYVAYKARRDEVRREK